MIYDIFAVQVYGGAVSLRGHLPPDGSTGAWAVLYQL